MKKILVITQISVGLFFISNTSIAQESAKKIEAIPESVLQKRVEPLYTPPTAKLINDPVKPDIALQEKAVKAAQKEEMPQPVIVPANLMQPTPASTIDTKMNTDKYYNYKPILPVEPPKPANKPIAKQKPVPNQVPAVVE